MKQEVLLSLLLPASVHYADLHTIAEGSVDMTNPLPTTTDCLNLMSSFLLDDGVGVAHPWEAATVSNLPLGVVV